GIVLEDVKVADPSFAINGDGAWTISPAGQQRTILNADVESEDVGKSLQSLGFDAGITGDKGSIVASLNWRDSPMGDVVPTLGGTIRLDLRDGQITEVKPGAGRLFGLLSITALPRRVLLNFSDVFGKGFGYDSITGDFTLQEGDAYTQDLLIKGPAASIHLLGRTGLAKQDFDEALIVDPNVGSTLPVVAGLAAGLVPGAVVFLLTEIFQKPITKAGESRYHLTGTWDAPLLTKMNGRTAPAPATKP
ncbi:MAG TPA: AsmA-like C-terminal region-containing protein, partial [Gammaproteobacteria bacterium]